MTENLPALWEIWLIALGLGAGGFLLARRRPILALFALAPLLFFAMQILAAFRDPQISDAVLRERGAGYVVQTYVAVVAGLLLPFAGALLKARKPQAR